MLNTYRQTFISILINICHWSLSILSWKHKGLFWTIMAVFKWCMTISLINTRQWNRISEVCVLLKWATRTVSTGKVKLFNTTFAWIQIVVVCTEFCCFHGTFSATRVLAVVTIFILFLYLWSVIRSFDCWQFGWENIH